MSNEKKVISFDEALKYLPEGDTIHTFRGGGGMMIGCDHDRAGLLADMQKAGEIEVAGSIAQALNHGLAIIDDHGPLFIETVGANEL